MSGLERLKIRNLSVNLACHGLQLLTKIVAALFGKQGAFLARPKEQMCGRLPSAWPLHSRGRSFESFLVPGGTSIASSRSSFRDLCEGGHDK